MCPTRLFVGLSALVVLAAPVLGQTVWKWKDRDGIVHYSDQPAPGAERIELRAQTSAASSSAAASANSQPANASGAASNAAPAYRNFEIWKPFPGATISGTRGQVSVGVRVEPALGAAHALWLYLDGRRVDGLQPNAAEYELMDVKNGPHSLVAVITDGRGNQVLSSQAVNFQVQ